MILFSLSVYGMADFGNFERVLSGNMQGEPEQRHSREGPLPRMRGRRKALPG